AISSVSLSKDSMVSRADRYWQTLRWLRPVQFYGRAWRLLFRPQPDLSPAPPLRLPTGAPWIFCRRTPSMTASQVLRFLGVERLISSPSDWNRSDWPKLWLYNAHYFDDLAASQSTGRVEWHRSLIAKWIAENAPGMGNGWEPYPTSLRIVNWVKWLLAGNRPVPGMVQSLAVQARWLRSRLEYHLLGNHLWANAKALVFAGYFFSGSEGAAWREHGVRVLSRELREQVLPD